MQTVDSRIHKAKAFAISSIMKNPKLASTVMEAWDAPLGSSKKSRAKAILHSIHKSSDNFLAMSMDGQGGGSYQSVNPFTIAPDGKGGIGTSANLAQTLGPGLVLPQKTSALGAPSLSLNKSGSLNIPTASSTISNSNYNALSTMGSGSKTNILGGQLSLSPSNTYGQIKGSTYTPPPSSLTGILNQSYDFNKMFPATNNQATKTSGPNTTNTGTYPGYTNPYTTNNQSLPTSNMNNVTPPGSTIWTQDLADKMYNDYLKSGITSADAAQRVFELTHFTPSVSSGSTDAPNQSYEDVIMGQIQAAMTSGNVDAVKQWYDSLDSSLKQYWKPVYDAVEAGVGPNTFAQQMLNDKDALAQLLQMPRKEIDSLFGVNTDSITLSSIRKAAEQQVNLDGALNRLIDMQGHGLFMEEDAKGYIRMKDEYLTQLDQLTTAAKDRIANMDTSNPYVAQRAQNYVGYLTTLSGRQTQRYIDFVNTAITYQNNQFSQAKTLYDVSAAKAQELYDAGAENYSTVKTMLGEMYANVQGRKQILLDQEKSQSEKITNSLTNLNKIMDIKKIQNDIDTNNNGTKFSASNVNWALGYTTDSTKGTINITNYDPFEAIRNGISANQDPYTIATQYILNNKNYIIQEGSKAGGNLNSVLSKYGNAINEVNTTAPMTAEEYVKNGMDPIAAQAQAKKDKDIYDYLKSQMLDNMIKPAVQASLRNYLTDNVSTVDITDAIKALTGSTGWFGLGGKISQKDFLSQYGTKLGWVADPLYEVYSTTGGDALGMGDVSKLSNKEIVNKMVNGLYERVIYDAITPTTNE